MRGAVGGHERADLTTRTGCPISPWNCPGAIARLRYRHLRSSRRIREHDVALFDPEKVALYRLARRHTRAVHRLIRHAQTRGHADLIDHLRRSAASIPANVLEAMGDSRPGKRLNYLMIARGSTWECWAHTDAMVDCGLVPATAIADVRDLHRQITALLIASIRNLEAETARKARRPPGSAPPRKV